DDLAPLDAATARAMEPALFCTSALLSPSTGIVDSHQLMLAYQGECESRGGALAFNSRVSAGALREGGFEIETADGTRLSCALLVNSAGLGAQRVARSLAGFPAGRIPEAWLVKGNYFTLQGKPPFTRLIYPVPAHAGLGVHVTLDLAGQVRFGPDTEDIDRLDYAVDPRRGDSFYAAIRRYYPALADGAILPGYAGIRPKLASAKTGQADFIIQGPESHRVPGLINYFGIESPGLTASLALADEALRRLGIAPAADD
ncbi:MAG: FAD-dependent oxidoreductase, partial [Alphaproteobacteria bacterium]|nr:FAD-dependent oxidoreductase [Alphaproteobacteria bacterium]